MSTVSTSSLLWCLVDLDVLDDEVGGVEALGVGIGFGVLEETEKELGGLDRPAGAGDTHLFSCRSCMLDLALSVHSFCLIQSETASTHRKSCPKG